MDSGPCETLDSLMRRKGKIVPVPIYALTLLSLVFYLVPAMRTTAYETPYLLLAINILFVTPVSLWVAAMALRAYLASGFDRILFAGSAVLVFGITSLIASLHVLEIDGLNHAVTIHNMGVLCAAVLHFMGCLQGLWLGVPRGSLPVRVFSVARSYGGVLVLMGLTWAAIEGEILPPFVVPGGEITHIRLLVLTVSILIFSFSALLVDYEFRKMRIFFLRVYGFGLALIALGLLGVTLATPGSILSWTGRFAQYLGNIYFFLAAMILVREARREGLDIAEAIAEFFLRSESQYRALVDASASAIISVDTAGKVFLWNPAAEACFGFSAEDAAGLDLPEQFVPPEARGTLRDAMAKDETTRTEMTLQRRDGRSFPAGMSIYSTGTGRTKATTFIIRDISERKAAKEALRLSEQRYRSLFSEMTEGFALHEIILDDWGKAVDYRFLEVNPAFERLTGLKAQDVVGKTVIEVMPGTEPHWVETYGEVALTGRAVHFENYSSALNKDFEVFAYRPAQGHFATVFLDITDRKRVERALRITTEDLSLAQSVAQTGSWRMNVQKNELLWSDENHLIFGILKGTPLTYETFLATIHPDDREYVDRRWMAALSGEHYDIEHRIVVDGRVKWVREVAILEVDDKGALLGGFGTTQDITERKQIEEALRKAKENLEEKVHERTEELVALTEDLIASRDRLRVLASELSLAEEKERKRIAVLLHDEVAQTLAAAKMRLDFLQADGGQEHGRNAMGDIGDLLAKAIRETRSLMTDISPPLLFDMGLAAACEALAERLMAKHNILINCDIRRAFENLGQEMRILIFQAIRELLINAVKHSGARNIHVTVEEHNGALLVRVNDDGAGFDPQALGAPSDAGGFGLFSIRERLMAFNGIMQIESDPKAGTQVTIVMPRKAEVRKKKKNTRNKITR
jgi:PAS domain S-box-containing protein